MSEEVLKVLVEVENLSLRQSCGLSHASQEEGLAKAIGDGFLVILLDVVLLGDFELIHLAVEGRQQGSPRPRHAVRREATLVDGEVVLGLFDFRKLRLLVDKVFEFLEEPGAETRDHAGTTGQDDILDCPDPVIHIQL